MSETKDRRVAYRQGGLRRAGPTIPRRLLLRARVQSPRVSKRSSANSTTSSTLSRLSLKTESSRVTRRSSQPSERTRRQADGGMMSASNPSSLPTSSEHPSHARPPASSPTSAASLSSVDSGTKPSRPDPSSRAEVMSRKSSGTNIVARDDPHVELHEGDETFEPDDARAMSPRRTSEDLEKMSQDARRQLSQHAKVLHESLLEIFNRIDAVKQEHDKLDSNNKFLQKYIGDLISTSKITASGAGGRKK